MTDWLRWFLETLRGAVSTAQETLDAVLAKTRFWQRWATTPLNARQVKLLNRLLDGFEGKLTSSKWAAIGKCSPDTALRVLNSTGMPKPSAARRATAWPMRPKPSRLRTQPRTQRRRASAVIDQR